MTKPSLVQLYCDAINADYKYRASMDSPDEDWTASFVASACEYNDASRVFWRELERLAMIEAIAAQLVREEAKDGEVNEFTLGHLRAALQQAHE